MTTTLLCILDGLGLNPNPVGNSVAQAKKQTLDKLFAESPWTTLITHGERVGLPIGQMGNSEVGHLNIGAGRVVKQWLYRISEAFNSDFFDTSICYKNFIKKHKDGGNIHLIGLCSDGGVHSHIEHGIKLALQLLNSTSGDIIFHIITDGRDTSPTSASESINKIYNIQKTNSRIKIGSISGRFFAMDRDKRWERTHKAYKVIFEGVGQIISDPISYIHESYSKNIYDEFIEPCVVYHTPISTKDGIVFWNFRADRMRQLTESLISQKFNGFNRPFIDGIKNQVLLLTDYDRVYGLPFLFSEIDIRNGLGETISNYGLSQLRIAETEKYPHVTYFFNGGREESFVGESRHMLPSPRDVKTYDLKPEMSAYGVTDYVIDAIRNNKFDLIVLNFANADMVGHTGVLSAGIKAVEVVDECLGKILQELKNNGGQALILADHGNCEQMINYTDGSPHTSHTTFPVPLILFNSKLPIGTVLRSDGALCDVAPTALAIMGLQQPLDMTGTSLITNN